MAVVTPDLPELFEEAFERAGHEMRSGYDLKTARRSLNLLLLEWQNRGLNMFLVDSGTITLTAGTATYTMPSDTVDIVEHSLRTGTGERQTDTTLERIYIADYAHQTNKNLRGRPSQVYVERLPTSVTVTLWPVPDSQTTYTLSYYRMKGVDGLSGGIGGDVTSVPPRLVPCLVAGLAYHIAAKKPNTPEPLYMRLKQEYEHQFSMALYEDGEQAPVRLVPYMR